MLKIAICDDDEVFLAYFTARVKIEFSAHKIETEIFALSDGIKLFNDITNFDVLFLDIDMPQIHGYEIADKVNKAHRPPVIVFVSGHDDFVYTCFEFKAFWFLRKSKLDKSNDLEKAVAAIVKKIDSQNELLEFHLNNGTDISLKIIDIVYFEVNGNLTEIHKKDDVFLSYISLSKYEKMLSNKFFARCDKNF